MSKKIRNIVIVIALYIGIMLIGTKVYATTGVTTNDSTRIRKKASTSSDIVEILMKNAEVEVLSEENGWYKIKYTSSDGEFTGYVRKDLLEVKENTQNTEQEKTDSEKTAEKNDESESEDATKQSDEKESEEKAEQSDENESEETSKNNNELDTSVNTTTDEFKLSENSKVKLIKSAEVRLIPIVFASITSKIPEGNEATITEIVGSWYYIECEGKNGWISKTKLENIIDIQDDSESETKDISSTDSDKSKNNEETKNESTSSNSEKTKYYVSATTLNMREKASTDAKVIEQLQLNEQVTLIEKVDSTWSKVKSGSNTGYVATKYLSTEKTEVVSRNSQEERTLNADSQSSDKSTSSTSSSNTSTSNTTSSNTTSSDTSKQTTSSSKDSSSTTKNEENSSTSTSKESSSTSTSKTETSKTDTSSSSSSTSSSSKTSSSKVTGADIVAYAKKFLGCKYVYGATGPSTFDCSGFTQYVYKHFGYTISRTSSAQRSDGKEVSRSNIQLGDIVCFSGHVGIYVGDDNFIHASHPGDVVKISSLSSSYYTTTKPLLSIRRIL